MRAGVDDESGYAVTDRRPSFILGKGVIMRDFSEVLRGLRAEKGWPKRRLGKFWASATAISIVTKPESIGLILRAC